ncbi:MAG TPA: hypothetical protein VF444_01465 [Pseudonocardiaceae bacterium]
MNEKRRPGRPATGQTPNRSIRMADDRWQRFGQATEQAGTDRSSAVNAFAAWYTRETDARLPPRPPCD